MELQLPPLLKWQEDVLSSPERYKVLAVGRQAGKTTLASLVAFTKAYQGGNVYWVAPIYEQGGPGWNSLQAFAESINQFHINQRKDPVCEIVPHKKLIKFRTGGTLQVKTGDDPDLLRGATLDFCVLEECAYLDEKIWNVIWAALAVKKGGCLFISTPLGKNWFYKLFLRGQDESEKDWRSWQLPSTVSPYFTSEDDEIAKNDPLIDYEQEILAEFTTSGYNVFRNVEDCLNAIPENEATPGSEYVIGVDWGRVDDYTVCCVLKTNAAIPELVCMERFRGGDWTLQRLKIQQLAERFQPHKIIAEQNSIGDVNIEELRKLIKCPIQAFYTSWESKRRIIDHLSNAFLQKQIAIIPNQALLTELQMFSAHTSKSSGKTIFGAPSKFHDDTVMSLAIAFSATKEAAQKIITFDRYALIGF